MFATIVLAAVAAFAFGQETAGAEDTWWKVANIDPGTELRVYKTGAIQPIVAKMDEANADRIVVIFGGKTQTAIPKSEIYRLDFRPPSKTRRIKREATTKQSDPSTIPSSKPGAGNIPRGTTESGNTITFGSKPDFQTIYRRSGN